MFSSNKKEVLNADDSFEDTHKYLDELRQQARSIESEYRFNHFGMCHSQRYDIIMQKINELQSIVESKVQNKPK